MEECKKLIENRGDKMLNFTVGPVMTDPEINEVARYSAPYFRTPEFSEVMFENERLMLEFLHAPVGSRCVFLTASGTAAMESCVMNVLNTDDKIVVINGGTFGQRFADLCRLHRRKLIEVSCEFGHQIRKEQLDALVGDGYTALLVNMTETSSGVLYDMPMISRFCKENNILLIIDAISAFMADELDMAALGGAVVLTGSQKALAVQPGISVVALSPVALERVEKNVESCMYLSLKEALKNMERGQTPFTPAVTIILQINQRLKMIKNNGGIEIERQRIVDMTRYFRKRIKDYPMDLVAENKSNAVTALYLRKHNAKAIVQILKDEYGIWVCPNGGIMENSVFRVGHIGYIRKENYEKLFDALDDLLYRDFL